MENLEMYLRKKKGKKRFKRKGYIMVIWKETKKDKDKSVKKKNLQPRRKKCTSLVTLLFPPQSQEAPQYIHHQHNSNDKCKDCGHVGRQFTWTWFEQTL